MGVYTDKIVGYMVDVTEEYNQIRDDSIWDNYIDDSNEKELQKELIEAGFKCYYSNQKPTKDNIMLIYDGMSGKYAKLIYIKSIEYYSNDESDANDIINEALKTVPVPNEIKDRLEMVYSTIFNSNKKIEVYLQEFIHWH